MGENIQLIDISSLCTYCGKVVQEYNPQAGDTFHQIIRSGKEKDRKLFIESIESIMGCKMSMEEIKEELEAYTQQGRVEDLRDKLIESIDEFIRYYKWSKDELALWTLTYVLDSEDLLFDSLDYMGPVDDWLVVKAAEQIINKDEKRIYVTNQHPFDGKTII